jgi:hypothetical protein
MKFAISKTFANLNISYNNKTVEEILTIKFFVLVIDCNLNWIKHVLP